MVRISWIHGLVVSLAWALLAAPAGATSLTTNLEGSWTFNGTGADDSGNGRAVTLMNGAGYAAGLHGQALDLHNAGWAERAVSDPVFDLQGAFTVQVWVNFYGSPNNREQTLIEKFSGGGGPGWTFTKQGGSTVQFYASGQAVTTGVSLQGGRWYQMIARGTSTLFEIFLDGTSIGSVGHGPFATTTLPLLIGRRNPGDTRDFFVDGRIDDVAIWSRALDNGEISALWNGGQGLALSSVPEPAMLAVALLGALAVRRRAR